MVNVLLTFVLESSNQYLLYSCGDGNVLQHNPNKLDKDAVDLSSLLKEANGPNVSPRTIY